MYSRELLEAKLQAIRACQAKTDYQPEPKRVAALKRKREAIKKAASPESGEKGNKNLQAQKQKTAAKERQKILPLRSPDLTAKIALKLDNRTTIYINPGDDVEAIKAKFRNRHQFVQKTPEENMKDKLGYNYQF